MNDALVPVWQGKSTAAAAYATMVPQANALLTCVAGDRERRFSVSFVIFRPAGENSYK